MPTTSKEGEAAESLKKIEDGGGEVKEDPSDSEMSKNGVIKEDSESKVEEANESEEVDKEKLSNEASTLLAQGKRHLFVKDYPSAVNALGDACAKFSALYGELGDECADAYFNYGCALLELAREESGVLDVDNKDKESEEDEDGEDEGEAGQDEKKDQEKSTEDEKTETEQKNTDEASDEKETKSAEEKAEGDETIADDEDEDVNNLQLAWEMFELAKVIFTRNNDEMKLADTYLRLGEVALESENYGSAITDIQNCLDLQQKVLPPVSREIAETLFQLGIACSLCNQFDDAIKHFTAAGVLLEKRIQKLIKMTEPDPEKAKNPFYTIQKEIDEIKALLPEIKDKIIDMEEFKNETMKAVVQATIGNISKESSDGAGPSTNGAPSSSSASPTKPVNDISHLVRKKRKNPEDDSPIETKKPCSESKTA